MTDKPIRKPEEAQESPTSTNGNESQPPTNATGIAVRELKEATGPRTEMGRNASSQNALKHAIFSKSTLLTGESRDEYRNLLEGLRRSLQPGDEIEELFVDKLASISWRYRRLLVAEGAEIRRNTEFLEWDQRNQEQEKAEEIGASPVTLDFSAEKDGLIRNFRNPHALERCLELLTELRNCITTKGLDIERDSPILQKLYGNKDQLRETMSDVYAMWLNEAQVSEEVRQREKYETPAVCIKNLLVAIDGEIFRLRKYQTTRTSIESNRAQLDALRRNVPDSPGQDRLLRYEVSLDRAFDRTLAMLERRQRIRQGQPVAPRIDVNLTS